MIKFHIPYHYLWKFYVGSHTYYSDTSFNDAVISFAEANECLFDSVWENGDAYTFTCNTEDDFLILKLKHPGVISRVRRPK